MSAELQARAHALARRVDLLEQAAAELATVLAGVVKDRDEIARLARISSRYSRPSPGSPPSRPPPQAP